MPLQVDPKTGAVKQVTASTPPVEKPVEKPAPKEVPKKKGK